MNKIDKFAVWISIVGILVIFAFVANIYVKEQTATKKLQEIQKMSEKQQLIYEVSQNVTKQIVTQIIVSAKKCKPITLSMRNESVSLIDINCLRIPENKTKEV